MDLWHEVEATVFLVTHSIAEAVYLGDRVWIMTRAPGRIGREFEDIIPKTRGTDPLTVQETAAVQGGGGGDRARRSARSRAASEATLMVDGPPRTGTT